MALLERSPQSLAPQASEPAPDRAPDAIAAGVAQPLRGELEALLGPDRVLTSASDIVKYASDASPYRLFPQAVVMAREAGDVAKVLAYGREQRIPVTFRAGGTSLNGQGQSDGILVDVRRHFGGVAVEEDGAPGAGQARHRARPRQPRPRSRTVASSAPTRPAPTSPASAASIANNSGGMRCGTAKDSYSTVRSLTLVLPSGTTIDTAAPDAAERFAAAEPELVAGLEAIRDEIRADAELSERIRRKFAIKNTTGYRLCAFLDADQPLEIFRRLVVGSEGTLAFVAEAVFETVPLPARTTTAWVHFPGIDEAIDPVRDAGRRRRHRGRADGRAGADHRRLEHGRRAGGVERAAAGVGGAPGRVRRRRPTRSSTSTSPGRTRSSPPARPSARSSSPARRRGSSWPGGCARACTG